MKWTISEVKQRGNATFRAGYWRCVLAAFIISLLGGGLSTVNIRFPSNTSFSSHFGKSQKPDVTDDDFFEYDDDDDIDEDKSFRYDFSYGFDEVEEMMGIDEMEELINELVNSPQFGVIMAISCVIFIFVLLISIALSAFLLVPIIIGCQRFFKEAGEKRSYELGNIVFAFSRNYMNIVKISFMMTLKIFLWSLLLIIPGIIKSYEYRMIPYILGDEPDIPMDEAFRRTKEMMTGNKWHSFLLDLSFIGWAILGVFTCGILLLFYVNPYMAATEADLYLTLKGAPRDYSAYNNARQFNGQPGYGMPPYGQNQYGGPGQPYGGQRPPYNDQTPPYGNQPYGQPPYGAPRPPYGQNPQYGQNPPYGQQPYGGQAYNAPYGQPGQPATAPEQPSTQPEPEPKQPAAQPQPDSVQPEDKGYTDGEYRELRADDDMDSSRKNGTLISNGNNDTPAFGDERNRISNNDKPFNTPY